MPTTPHVIVQKNPEACAKYVEEQIISLASKAIELRGRCVIVLAGGSTPKLLYESLAKLPSSTLDWSKIVLLWGDERNVPSDHQDSNYRMVQQALLNHLPADRQPLVLRIPTGDLPADQAALEYDSTLAKLLEQGNVKLDIVLLGIGDDAHTASLFPATQALLVRDRLVVENWVEKLNTWRVTLTYDAINRAEAIYFLVCGASKTVALRQIWGEERNLDQFPAQGVQSIKGTTVWVIDQAASKGLEKFYAV